MSASKMKKILDRISYLNTALVVLTVEVISFWWKKLIDRLSRPSEIDSIKAQLDNAKTYEEYLKIGRAIDAQTGAEDWKINPVNQHYDHQLIRRRLKHLRELVSSNDLQGMMDFLRSGLLRNLGGLNEPKLHSYCYVGTKSLIEEYIGEVDKQLERISNATPEILSPQEKMDFIHDTKQAFGCTALILHGGSTFGLYHIGVVRSLLEQGLLPQVICGTEIGALIAALVGIHTNEELPKFLKTGGIDLGAFIEASPGSTFKRKMLRFLKTGHLLDVRVLEKCVKSNTGDITFEEAFRRTNRILNISVSPTRKNEVPQLLNYLTAPNVLIRSAACASAAVIGLYDSVELLIKDESGNIVPWNTSAIRWANSHASDIESPLTRLSELFNVNHFIVSQANPYIVPFMSRGLQLQEDGIRAKLRNILYAEVQHRLLQLDQIRLLPRLFKGLVDQKFAGHVTLFPLVSLTDFNSLFSRLLQLRWNIGLGKVNNPLSHSSNLYAIAVAPNSHWREWTVTLRPKILTRLHMLIHSRLPIGLLKEPSQFIKISSSSVYI